LWSHLAEFFLEWAMFHTNAVDKPKRTHFIFSIFSPKIVPFKT
jgi:hypothetical protein